MTRKPDPPAGQTMAQMAVALIEWGAERMPALRRLVARLATSPEEQAEQRAELGYEEVVRFLVTSRAEAGDQAVGGAAVLQRRAGDLVVDVCFVDRNDDPMIGVPGVPHRTYVARRLDPELRQAFGDNNVILFT